MQTKKYAPLILTLLAVVLAILHLIKYIDDQKYIEEIYILIAAALFMGAALCSFIKNSNMIVGWYLYIAAFLFWMAIQFLGISQDMGNIVNILSSVLIGLFIIVYLVDDEVKASFSYEFSFNK